jgi:hypothetical protein
MGDGEIRFRFPGGATDGDAQIEATGRGDVTAAVLVFMGRSEDGRDLDVLRWHLFDHVPEQFRVPGVRNGQRWVSTPECRAARFASAPFENVDYVVQYLFAEPAPQNVTAFAQLGKALGHARRFPGIRQPIYLSGGFEVVGMRTNPRGALGAYVLPWYPASGIFLTMETTPADPAAGAEIMERLVELEGVAGAWRYAGGARDFGTIKTDHGKSATVYYLYDDPVEAAGRLRDAVEREWSRAGVEGLFAAPLYVVRPFELEKRLP